MIETDIFAEPAELMRFAAEKFSALSERAIEDNGVFTVALSGGSTPAELYRLLASDEFGKRLDPSNTKFFFGDERYVPANDERSNFRMANETLLEPLGVPAENVFRWKTELDPEAAAADYRSLLKEHFGSELPRFDLVLLGLGNDGHTASLFPGTEALRETELSAVANLVEELGETRLTLTFPAVNNAANAMFLIVGPEKALAARHVFEGDFYPDIFPAQLVVPANGNLYRLLDAEAGELLSRE